MWFKTVLCVFCAVTCVLAEEVLENNEIDSEDFLMQDLTASTKHYPGIFDPVDKQVAKRTPESEKDLKHILAKDIQKRIEALQELNEAFEVVKAGIDTNKSEAKGNEISLLESKNTTHQTEISSFDPSSIEDASSRTTRQYHSMYTTDEINRGRQYSAIDNFGREGPLSMNTFQELSPLLPLVTYGDENDPYIAQYNPSARTFGIPVTNIQGGLQANIKTDTTGGNKEGSDKESAEKTRPAQGVIKEGGSREDHIHGHGHGHAGGVGGGIGGGTVHPIKQIKYLLPNFLSALTAAIGGSAAAAAGGAGVGGLSTGIGGIGGGIGGIGGEKHKHKHEHKPVVVHKVKHHPIKIKPVTHATGTNVVPIKKFKKEKGGYFYSKNVFFGKIGAESHHGSEALSYSQPSSYYNYPHGGYSGYSYLSPFNLQYAERSPVDSIAYLPDAQSIYGAGYSTYPQDSFYPEPAYLPYAQGQYFYPVDVKSLDDGRLAQLQFYPDPNVANNPSSGNDDTNTNPDYYVRSESTQIDQKTTPNMNIKEVKASIEDEQRRIKELQDGLKSYAKDLDTNQDEGRSNQ